MPMGEKTIKFSHTVGIFNNAGDKAPAVLLLHGFASSKDEVGNLYKQLSDELFKVGISSLRIDFRGWGGIFLTVSQSMTSRKVMESSKVRY